MNPELRPTPSTPTSPVLQSALEPLNAAEFSELDAMLDALRTQSPATPRWEFCEGFMAALICCRRPITSTEYLPVLLGSAFADAAQHPRFMELWTRRWNAVLQALDTKVSALDDAAAYQPEVVDARAIASALPVAQPGSTHRDRAQDGNARAQ